MNRAAFVHLRTRTHYSFFRSLIKPEQLAARAAELRMPGIAITDVNILSGVPEFVEACGKYGVLPLIGIEITVGNDDLLQAREPGSLILIAHSQEGVRNLFRLSSVAALDAGGVLNMERLAECSGGLLCFTGYQGSRTFRSALQKNEKELDGMVYRLSDVFGRENIRFALESSGRPDQEAVVSELVSASQRTGVPCAATCVASVISPEDIKYLHAFNCLGHSVDFDPQAAVPAGYGWLMSEQEMMRHLPEPQWHVETLKILELCTFPFPEFQFSFPECPSIEGYPARSYLEHLCRKELEKRLPGNRRAMQRLDRELSVIERMGFQDYFLVMWDLVREAEKRGIPVSGRGSVTGSMVAWLLGITHVNPLDHGLLFERFLNQDRISLPDVDLDVAHNRREELLEYLVNTYGREHVAQVIAFGTLKAKAALRDCGRLLKVPRDIVDGLVKKAGNSDLKVMMQDRSNRSEVLSDPVKSQLLDYATRFEGLVRHAMVHAAGVVLSSCPLQQRVPLHKMNDGTVVTGFAKDYLEQSGLIKVDILGLKTLTVIDETQKMIESGGQVKLPDWPTDKENRRIFSRLQKGRTAGVFQLESSGITELTVKLKPEGIDDLIALIALYRPGPLGSGMVEEYLQCRRKTAETHLLHPELQDILGDTHGIFIYQEQVMQTAMKLAGFSASEADIFRKIMGSKDSAEMRSLRDRFVSGAIEKGLSEKSASAIFGQISHFAGYGFNKSHATAYAFMAYKTAWLKTVYPCEYLACLMSYENEGKIQSLVNECRNVGIRILPPDVNVSQYHFTVEKRSIRVGLTGIKHLGKAAALGIIERRESQGDIFRDAVEFLHFASVLGIHRNALESLADSGAMDVFGLTRSKIHDLIDRHSEPSGRKHAQNGQMDLTDLMEPVSQPSKQSPENLPEFNEGELLKREKSALGFHLLSHPLTAYEATWGVLATHTAQTFAEVNDGAVVVLGGIVSGLRSKEDNQARNGKSFRLQDFTGEIFCVTLPSALDGQDWNNEDKDLVVARGRAMVDGHSRTFVAERVVSFSRLFDRLSLICMVPVFSDAMLSSLRELIRRYRGKTPLYLELKTEDHRITILCGQRIKLGEAFMREAVALGFELRLKDVSVN